MSKGLQEKLLLSNQCSSEQDESEITNNYEGMITKTKSFSPIEKELFTLRILHLIYHPVFSYATDTLKHSFTCKWKK
jgi:hypothetical protein